ncbi:MAG: glycosyltransferase [Chloroflexi bacterium]|nr:glycosyltransferase [Chloroflexota bacterium]
MFGNVPLPAKRLSDYRRIVGEERLEEIRALARPLRGARVLHLNSTAFGGGVAELLSALVPLLNTLGLRAEWQVIRGDQDLFAVTKSMHNGLQGMPVTWTNEMKETWLRFSRLNAALFDQEYDFVYVHDQQPLGLLAVLAEEHGKRGRWVWRCHVDLSTARSELWEFMRPYVEQYDGVVFTLPEFAKNGLKGPQVFAIPPGIDPLSPKNVALTNGTVTEVLARYGIDAGRPLLLQVSRFDPWKDPLGVIDAYRSVKEEEPSVQLVLIAPMAHDDPEGWSYLERTARKAGEDYDIHLLSNVNGVGDREVNAFQRAASVVIQKSVREGFGLVIAEALWKERPVVAANVGGIPLQVLDGKTGFLVNSIDEAAERTLRLLRQPELGRRLGEAGREHVRGNFLVTRYLRDHLQLMRAIAGVEAEPARHRGPSDIAAS